MMTESKLNPEMVALILAETKVDVEEIRRLSRSTDRAATMVIILSAVNTAVTTLILALVLLFAIKYL